MIKGTTTIELTDVDTGEVVTVEDHNFFTNAFSDLCQPILRDHDSMHRTVSLSSSQITTNELLGGLLLFDSPLGENADNYFPPITVNMVGHGSEVTYSGSDLSLGSFNNTMSDTTSAGTRKYVWDFTAEQANGEIASVCLTTKGGAHIGHGTKTPNEKVISKFRHFGNYIRAYGGAYLSQTLQYVWPMYLSFKDDYLLVLELSTIPSGVLHFERLNFWSHKEDIWANMYNRGMTSSPYTYIGNGHTDYSVFDLNLTDILGTTGNIALAQDGKHLYVARNTSRVNDATWMPNEEIALVKINLEDFSYESLNVTNTTGEYLPLFDTPSNFATGGYSFAVSNGYLFAITRQSNGTQGANLAKMYAINLNDNTIVRQVKTAEGVENIAYSVYSYYAIHAFGMTINEHISFVPYQFNTSGVEHVMYVNANDFVVKYLPTLASMGGDSFSTSTNTRYRVFPTDNSLYFGASNIYNLNKSAAFTFYVHFYSNVLMTINNLQTPVTKTPSQTMRITYTITKEE